LHVFLECEQVQVDVMSTVPGSHGASLRPKGSGNTTIPGTVVKYVQLERCVKNTVSVLL